MSWWQRRQLLARLNAYQRVMAVHGRELAMSGSSGREREAVLVLTDNLRKTGLSAQEIDLLVF